MYDLHRLGWSSFQHLCLTITREILGQTVTSYLDSNDGGRDGAFSGTWKPSGQENLTGQFVIQCKFTNDSGTKLHLSDLSDELPKIAKLVEQGMCDVYVLITNAGLSGNSEATIKSAILAEGVKHAVILGSTWIITQIRENARLRMLVPRVYGLGDLTQILDERAYKQAHAIIESLRDDLSKVVITNSYRRAAAALNEHGFVLLIGEPAAGKTTIASLLSMVAVDQWKSLILKLDDPSTVVEHWNPDEPSQFFWLDDAFGVTQYESSLVLGWNHILPQIKTIISKGARIVMTSRDYIYNRARKELKESAFPLLNESQVVVDVHDLSDNEKRQILYNHLKLGKQPLEFKRDIKPYLESVATHSRFVPEIARRLANPLFTASLHLSEYHVEEFVRKREQLLREVLQGLDKNSKAALALIYMRNDRLQSPIELAESESHALARLGSDLGGCVAALEALKDSLVIHAHVAGDSIWRFKHPTVGDAYADILSESPELLGIYVQGSTSDKLLQQVTCGDVGVEKAVVLPNKLFPHILKRLREFSTDQFKSALYLDVNKRHVIYRFLARRCSKEFLNLYLQEHPELLEKVSKPGLMLYAVPEVDLAVRLHEFALLPEENRKTFVSTVVTYAIEGDDVSALNDVNMANLFEKHELHKLREDVRTKLLPKLDDLRMDLERNYDGTEPADEYMQSLIDIFDTLRTTFREDEIATKLIKREADNTRSWIDENSSSASSTRSRSLGEVETSDKPTSSRSIFDDIDL